MNRFFKTILIAFALAGLVACSGPQNTNEPVSVDEPFVKDKYGAEYGLKMSETEELYVNIRGFNFVDDKKLDKDTKSELKNYMKEADDKVYAVDFVIEDNRKNPSPISLDSSSTDEDRIDVYIIDKNDKRVDPVATTKEEMKTQPNTHYVYFYIFKDEKDIKKIAVDSYLGGETILGSGVELDYEEIEEN